MTKPRDDRPCPRPCVEIMIVDVKGSAPREPGALLIWTPDERIEGTIGGGRLECEAIDEARRLWADPKRATAFVEYPLGVRLGQCCGGVARVFLRKSLPARRALICGAGHVSRALARTLAETPIRVSVADPRPDWADPGQFPANVAVETDECEAAVRDAAEIADETYLLVMTHDHPTDLALCALALRYPFRWIGLIGSRTKWLRFRQRLLARGFTEAELARISCPIGDPALGRSPQEIAVSVAAQILAVHHGVEYRRASEAGGGAEGEDLARGGASRAVGPRAGLILAGGASSRMGRWKGGLDYKGEPLALAHARAIESAGAEAWRVVYPASDRAEAERFIPPPRRAMNTAPSAPHGAQAAQAPTPMFASLQFGLRELLKDRFDIDSLLLTPVDAPPLPGELIAALWDRHESTGAWITRPEVEIAPEITPDLPSEIAPAADLSIQQSTIKNQNSTSPRHGHPIILGRAFFPLILAADPADARLDFLARDLPDHLKATLRLETTLGLANMNTPEDYAEVLM